MKDRLFVSVTKVFPILSYLDGLQISRRAFCAEAGLPIETFEFPDSKLSLAQRMTGDEFVGLHMGEFLTKGFSHILGYVMMNCATLLQALEKFSTYERLVDETTRTSFYEEKNCTVIESAILDKSINSLRQLAEYKLSGSYSYTKLLTEQQIRIVRVEFMHAAATNKQEYDRVFGCTIRFRQSRNALVMNSASLRLPIREPNPQLLAAFETNATAMLKSVSATDSFSYRTSRILASMMSGVLPGIEEIAKRQAVSVRKLQMKLKEEGTSYRHLLDEVRKGMAMRYLRDRTMAISEIAYLLGFSEPSVFHRSFKRWTDRTPQEFRMEYRYGVTAQEDIEVQKV
ncbi:MAG: AraC family transcriptional regulator [Spirochaetota bacterium]